MIGRRVKVLDVKSVDHYVVREMDTQVAERYAKLEALMDKTYCDGGPEEMVGLDTGSMVAVKTYVDNHDDSSHHIKRWLRAVVRNVFMSVGSFLYQVYLVDYGGDRCVRRSLVRKLRPHFDETFVSFQAMDLYLYAFEPKSDEQSDDQSLQRVKRALKAEDWLVLAHSRQWEAVKGCVWATLTMSDGKDLLRLLSSGSQPMDNRFIKDTNIQKPKGLWSRFEYIEKL